jgi:adenylosuccinate synthase
MVAMFGVIVVGLQWGDEGKGKMIDLLSEKADLVVRSQGGNNAGHTIVVGETEYRFHLVPSGIVYPHTRCYIGGGVALDLAVFIDEIERLKAQGVKIEGRLFLSPHIHLILPPHRTLDKLYEEQKGKEAIGTTGRGIGPSYSDRAARIGLRVCDLLNKDVFRKRLKLWLEIKNSELTQVFGAPSFDFEELLAQIGAYADRIRNYVRPIEREIDEALKGGKTVLFEGAHGTFLDTTFGTYPFVTSCSTLSGGITFGAGIGPTRISHTLGVVKAYTTRVGNGPLPTALVPAEEKLFLDHAAAREVGTTTGRKRRMGWFDAVLIKQAICLNGASSLALTKLDILDDLKEIKIATHYLSSGKKIDTPPACIEEWEGLEPVYETLPGWLSSTKDAKSWDELPKNAQKYVRRIEELLEVPISMISLGPERARSIILHPIFNK